MRNEAELSKSNTCEAWGHMWDRYAQLASLFFKLDNVKELVGGGNRTSRELSPMPVSFTAYSVEKLREETLQSVPHH